MDKIPTEKQNAIYDALIPPGYSHELTDGPRGSILTIRSEKEPTPIEIFLSEDETEKLKEISSPSRIDETFPELIHTFYLIAQHDPLGYEDFRKGMFRFTKLNIEEIREGPLGEFFRAPTLTPSHEVLEYRKVMYARDPLERNEALTKLSGSMFLSIEQGVNEALQSFMYQESILSVIPYMDLLQEGYAVFLRRLKFYDEKRRGRLFKYIRQSVFFYLTGYIMDNRNNIRIPRSQQTKQNPTDKKWALQIREAARKARSSESLEDIIETRAFGEDGNLVMHQIEDGRTPTPKTILRSRVDEYLLLIVERGIELNKNQLKMLRLSSRGMNREEISAMTSLTKFAVRDGLERAKVTLQYHIKKGSIPDPREFLDPEGLF